MSFALTTVRSVAGGGDLALQVPGMKSIVDDGVLQSPTMSRGRVKVAARAGERGKSDMSAGEDGLVV